MSKKYGPVGEERNPVVWWLLSVVCFVVSFVWVYKTWTEIAEFTKKDIDPVKKVLLMLIPYIGVVIFYQMFEEIAEMEKMVGIDEEDRLNPMQNILMCCLFGISINYAQEHLNEVWDNA